ncbi:hypothetical protein D3OALGA1CA_1431 [Olavius algarvensis associated proteobacterium Delta 3]|nr:hypothetical protein D3OALGB2SA_879 [Olavius algarvensis associated proteobacterium Delta 3]CAB5101111.1 hypothetical protein D3OALGA1CA_1431 [Olavius algarvensis associated proteobacterium Delta 3]
MLCYVKNQISALKVVLTSDTEHRAPLIRHRASDTGHRTSGI